MQQSDGKEDTAEGNAKCRAETCSVQWKREQDNEDNEDDAEQAKKEIEEANTEEDARLSEELYWLRYYEVLRGETERDAKLSEEDTHSSRECDDVLRGEDDTAWSEYSQEIEEEKGSSGCYEEKERRGASVAHSLPWAKIKNK